MRGDAIIMLCAGTAGVLWAAYQVYTGRAVTKFGRINRDDAAMTFWLVVGMTLAISVVLLWAGVDRVRLS
jgi:hypothetical protein